MGRGVHLREEALRQLVGLALADLVGRDGHQRVVPALGLHRHADLPDRPCERAPAGLLLGGRQPRAEELGRESEDLIGRRMGAVEVLHLTVRLLCDSVKRET